MGTLVLMAFLWGEWRSPLLLTARSFLAMSASPARSQLALHGAQQRLVGGPGFHLVFRARGDVMACDGFGGG